MIPYISLFSNGLVLLLLAWYIGVQLRKILQKTTRFENRVFLVLFGILHLSVSLVFALTLDRLPSVLDPHDFFNAALYADSWLQLFDFGHGFLVFFHLSFGTSKSIDDSFVLALCDTKFQRLFDLF